MIAISPVVVLSGRGGCGKTHVVSTVLSKALNLKRAEVAPASESSILKHDEYSLADVAQSLSDTSQTISQGCLSPLPASSCSVVHENPTAKEEICLQNTQSPPPKSEN